MYQFCLYAICIMHFEIGKFGIDKDFNVQSEYMYLCKSKVVQ